MDFDPVHRRIDDLREHTNDRFDDLKNHTDKNFDVVYEKLNRLYEFKWQIIGGSVVVSSLFGVVIAIVTVYLMVPRK